MALKLLPNTAVTACIVSKDEIYTYAQLYDGRIVEIPGRLAGNDDTYQPTGTQNIIDITNSGSDSGAKRFTPLAAVYFEYQVTSFHSHPAPYMYTFEPLLTIPPALCVLPRFKKPHQKRRS
jgi:hypothetical protein